MKISKLSCFTRSQITALATAMAQIKVAGFKGTQKSIVSAFAALESLNLEAFLSSLDKRHREAYSITKQEACFIKNKYGLYILSSVNVSIDVVGFTSDYIVIYQSFITDINKEKDTFILSENIFPSISSGGRNSSTLTASEKNNNLQLSINKSFEICNQIIENRLSSPEFFKNNGWKTKFIN